MSNGMVMNPGKGRRGWLAFVALVLCVSVPAIARAQTEADKKAQAKELYERATRLYDVGKYGDAIDAYEKAYLLVEDPALLYNIGKAYRLWDRPEDAVRSYKNYLRKRPEASNRPDVERKIAELERTIDERRRSGGAAAATAVPSAPPSPAPATANPAGPAAPEEGAYPGAGPTGAVLPANPPSAEPAGVDLTQPAGEPRPKRNWLAWGLVGGGGAFLIFSAAMAAVGSAEANKLRDASRNHEAFDPNVEKTGKAANVLAIVGLVAGVGAGGVGAYLFWRDSRSQGPAASIVPEVAPSYAGARALLTF